jgi:uncharacterized protein YndB with AHSA1/START domain
MPEHSTATASIVIAVPPAAVWAVLVDPASFFRWYGLTLDTTWRPGAPMAFTGSVGSKKVRDHGTVVEVTPPSRLSWRYFSRITGLPDEPQNYATIALTLAPEGPGTLLTVTHAVPPSPVRKGKDWEIGPESGHKHVEFWWRSTLPILKAVAEGRELPLAASMRS